MYTFKEELSMMQGLLRKQYKVVSLQWRMVGEDRVIEQHFCHDDIEKTKSFGDLQADSWLCIASIRASGKTDWMLTKVVSADFHKDNWQIKKPNKKQEANTHD